MVEQNLVDIGRSHRSELRVVKRRVDGSEDRDTLGLAENKRQVRVHRYSGRGECRQLGYPRDSLGDVPRYWQDVGNDLERLK